MSSKINIYDILSGHLNTLVDSSTNKVSKWDIFTFFIVPLLIAVAAVAFRFKFTDTFISLLVNFGAIFTALLLSVLVLVYDQSAKLKEKELTSNNLTYTVKKNLLQHLYYNICYAIIISVSLVVSCFIESISRDKAPLPTTIDQSLFVIDFNTIFSSPLTVFITIHLLLTILMIVKRMHALLISD
jgi:hypothetical protein